MAGLNGKMQPPCAREPVGCNAARSGFGTRRQRLELLSVFRIAAQEFLRKIGKVVLAVVFDAIG